MSLRVGITCFPTFGGSGIIATEIGLSLARRGHQIHFICADIPSRLDRFTENVFFHAVEAREYPLFDASPYAIALASKMVEVTRWERLDLLHVHYAVPHATSAYLARQILRASPGVDERTLPRIVTTLHGTDITLVGNDPSFLPVTRFSILSSDALTTPSAALRADTYRNLDIAETVPIEVIPNFIDEDHFRPAPRRADRLRGLFADAPPDAALLIHSSNFRPLKRVEDAVRILAEVRRVRPAVLVLVGDGPDRSRVEALARELGVAHAVRLLGNQLNFLEVLQQADVFLLPSAMESFGLAALEALGCGVPVVGSRIGGVPEVIADGEWGVLCEVGDVKSMAAAVISLCSDEDRRTRMALAARAAVESRWRKEPIVSRYEDCYRRVLAAR